MTCTMGIGCKSSCEDCKETLPAKKRLGQHAVDAEVLDDLRPAVTQCREAMRLNRETGDITIPAALQGGMTTIFARDGMITSVAGDVETRQGRVCLSFVAHTGYEAIYINNEKVAL